MGNIGAIHENNIKPTDFFAHFSPFNLKELEFNVCRIADHHNGKDDSRLDDDRKKKTPNSPAPLQSAQPRSLRPFHELIDMVYDGEVFSMKQHTNLYFHLVQVINDLVESFQMYATHRKNKQAEQALYYEKIIKNIDIVLQTDQVACIHEDLPHVSLPRYILTLNELENDNIRVISQSSCGDADVTEKEMQIIHREFLNKRDSRNNCPDSHSRLRNIDDLMDMGFKLTRFSPIPTVGDTVPQTPVGSGTITPVPTSTPRPNGGLDLQNSDLIPNREHTHVPNLYNSFTDLQRQFDSQ